MTFIIHFKDGHRETYNNRYNEGVEFIRSNHPKYRKYAVEWINNLTTAQLSYFKKEMLKSIII